MLDKYKKKNNNTRIGFFIILLVISAVIISFYNQNAKKEVEYKEKLQKIEVQSNMEISQMKNLIDTFQKINSDFEVGMNFETFCDKVKESKFQLKNLSDSKFEIYNDNKILILEKIQIVQDTYIDALAIWMVKNGDKWDFCKLGAIYQITPAGQKWWLPCDIKGESDEIERIVTMTEIIKNRHLEKLATPYDSEKILYYNTMIQYLLNDSRKSIDQAMLEFQKIKR